MNWSLMHTQQRSIISIAYHLMLDNLLVEAKRKNCNFFSMRSQCEKSNLHFACIFMRDETFIFLIDCNLLNVCTHGADVRWREKKAPPHIEPQVECAATFIIFQYINFFIKYVACLWSRARERSETKIYDFQSRHRN